MAVDPAMCTLIVPCSSDACSSPLAGVTDEGGHRAEAVVGHDVGKQGLRVGAVGCGVNRPSWRGSRTAPCRPTRRHSGRRARAAETLPVRMRRCLFGCNSLLPSFSTHQVPHAALVLHDA